MDHKDYLHVLIAADQTDAEDYAGDPQYHVIKYVGDPRRLEGLRCHEVSFTPRATNMPHWMDSLQTMQHNLMKTTRDWRDRIHYIPLFEPEAP